MQDLSEFRKSYEKYDLNEKDVKENPLELFRDWFLEAVESDAVDEANAMSIATVGLDGYPKTRVVLLKKYTEEGFVFYTNYQSEKGQAILANPKVCLSFFWPGMERQIIIKGEAHKIADNLSDGYFESRPKLSQISAIVSPQSQIVPSRKYLEEKQRALQETFAHKNLQRPAYWGGFLVEPVSLEFWQGRPNRLHDRIIYTLEKDYNWAIHRLAP